MAYFRVTQRNPFDELVQLQKHLSRFFDSSPALPQRAFPPVNLYDDGETFHLRAEVAGLDAEHLDLAVAGDVLTVKGQRSDETLAGSYHRRERAWTQFSRSITLPDSIDVERVSASYKDGVLEVELPRAPEARPRKITIETRSN